MAAAIGPAIGVGSSIIGGIQGKGAAKRQEKMLQEQLNMMRPLMQAQADTTRFALDQGRQLFPQAQNALQTVFNAGSGSFEPLMKDYQSMLREATTSQGKFFDQGDALSKMGREALTSAFNLPELTGAQSALGDLQQFYRPFMFDGQRAIDKFLPGQQQLNKLLAGDFANVNQGFKSASENIANFAPRGGGRVSTLANADVDRQRQITQLGSQGRQSLLQTNLQNAFQGAAGTQNVANALTQLGLGRGQLQGQLGLGAIGAGQQEKQLGISDFGAKANVGLNQLQSALQALGLAGGAAGGLGQLASGTLGQGLGGGGQLYDMFNQQANRINNLDVQSLRNQSGAKGLGGFVVDLFNTKGLFGGGGGKGTTTMPNSKIPG